MHCNTRNLSGSQSKPWIKAIKEREVEVINTKKCSVTNTTSAPSCCHLYKEKLKAKLKTGFHPAGLVNYRKKMYKKYIYIHQCQLIAVLQQRVILAETCAPVWSESCRVNPAEWAPSMCCCCERFPECSEREGGIIRRRRRRISLLFFSFLFNPPSLPPSCSAPFLTRLVHLFLLGHPLHLHLFDRQTGRQSFPPSPGRTHQPVSRSCCFLL